MKKMQSGAIGDEAFTLFTTSLGSCAIAWTSKGITHLQLPEETREKTIARMKKPHATATETKKAPKWVRDAIEQIAMHLEGEPQDFTKMPLDLSQTSEFYAKVYEAARKVPPAKTVTYGEIAKAIGAPKGSRAVGQALGRNPIAVVVPCHRVVASNGAGGFSAYGGLVTKEQILKLEGGSLTKETPQRSLFQGGAPLPFDPKEAVRVLSAQDPKLAKWIAKLGPMNLTLKESASIFESLAESIIYQQLNGKAAATILGRVRTAVKPRWNAKNLLATSDTVLRGAGLSQNKLLALKDLAKKSIDGTLPTIAQIATMHEDEIVARLTEVRGIGVWTVHMLLMFRLGRGDVLPVGDYGVRKGFAHVYGLKELPTPAEMEKRAAKWKPYRTAASWYMWRVLDSLNDA